MTNRTGRVASLLLAALVCLAPLGCNVVRVSFNASLGPEDVAFIVPGQTTLSEVVAKLGVPNSIVESDSGIVATYRFLDLKYSRVNFGWLAKPWTPVDPDLIFSRTGLGVDAFQLLCDPQWVVLNQEFQRHLTRPPFHPYPFQQSRVSPQDELRASSGPAIMARHDPGNIRSHAMPNE
ncbi:MAG: hypothetical protein OEV01_02445 [Nitrospira sp.]|nr:hypothetical protein [Nitrospira sp.]MDH4303310.1 hypothetical protein [Nitrospira sp.]MDH5194407.1 hypothetical protein [Nitrospira sp.]